MKKLSFLQKLLHILGTADPTVVSWCDDGCSFVVSDVDRYVCAHARLHLSLESTFYAVLLTFCKSPDAVTSAWPFQCCGHLSRASAPVWFIFMFILSDIPPWMTPGPPCTDFDFAGKKGVPVAFGRLPPCPANLLLPFQHIHALYRDKSRPLP